MDDLTANFSEGRLRIAGSVTWKTEGQTLWFFSDATLRIDNVEPSMLVCLALLKDGATYAELSAAAHDDAQLDYILETLIRLKYVIRAEPNRWTGTRLEKQVEYFAAQGLDANAAQALIENAHVVIAGLGGIGTVILQHMVAAGVRIFTLIDFDSVQPHNLNRQFIYSPSNIGQPKGAVAAEYVRSIEPKATINLHQAKIDDVAVLRAQRIGESASFFVLSADEPPGRVQLAALTFCHERAIPLLLGGCGIQTATWGPLITHAYSGQYLARMCQQADQPTNLDINMLPLPEKVMSASFGPTNTIVAAFMARDILHYLVGLPVASLNRTVILDYETLGSHSRAWFD